jgi:hypothetical protein
MFEKMNFESQMQVVRTLYWMVNYSAQKFARIGSWVIQNCEKFREILGRRDDARELAGLVEWVQKELELIGKEKPAQVEALLRKPEFGVKVATVPEDPPPVSFSIKDRNWDIWFTLVAQYVYDTTNYLLTGQECVKPVCPPWEKVPAMPGA